MFPILSALAVVAAVLNLSGESTVTVSHCELSAGHRAGARLCAVLQSARRTAKNDERTFFGLLVCSTTTILVFGVLAIFEHSGPACDRHDGSARIILLSAVCRDLGQKGSPCRLSAAMTPVTLSAYTLVTANGRGVNAVSQALRERRSGLRPCDFEDVILKTYIGRVDGLEDFALEMDWSDSIAGTTAWPGSGCNRMDLWSRWRRPSSGMAPTASPSSWAPVPPAFSKPNMPIAIVIRKQARCRGGLPRGIATRTICFLWAILCAHVWVCGDRRWSFPPPVLRAPRCLQRRRAILQAGLCDAAIVGGVDSLCLTTLYGFSSLQLLSHEPCRPCDEDRDGLSLGEAAGYALLESSRERETEGRHCAARIR